jgi:hypothetical protein
MKYISLFSLIFFSLLYLQASCKKDNDNLREIALNSKSETEIRALMTGRWKIHYSNGYMGYRVCNECYWDITSTDTLTETYDGAFFSKNRIKYEKTGNNNDWLMINYSGVGTVSWILNSLKDDTLISTYIGTTTSSYLTKQ